MGRDSLSLEYVSCMRAIAAEGALSGDYEESHYAADRLLCKFLEELGYEELVKTYDTVNKWYA